MQVPPGARVSNAVWSPDGASIAYLAHTDEATQIWIADVASARSRQLTRTPLLATMVSAFEFTANGKQIAAVLIPDNRVPMPVAPAAPTGPTVKLADSARNRLRTFASLMSTQYDYQLLEWHATGQPALIDVQKGTVKKVGAPAMVRSIDASPDGKYIRVTRMLHPFSYDVPVSNFGSIEELVDTDGKVLAKLNDRPINLGVQDDTPGDPPVPGGGRGGQANQQGRRELAWRADGQGLTYLEQEPAPEGAADDAPAAGRGRGAGRGAAVDDAQDAPSGRGARAPQRKDRLYQWLPPVDDARRCSSRATRGSRAIASRRTCRRCSRPNESGRTPSSSP
jgi:dipeptidyl aminopeptidase/acylaminoacyl peptidase